MILSIFCVLGLVVYHYQYSGSPTSWSLNVVYLLPQLNFPFLPQFYPKVNDDNAFIIRVPSDKYSAVSFLIFVANSVVGELMQ